MDSHQSAGRSPSALRGAQWQPCSVSDILRCPVEPSWGVPPRRPRVPHLQITAGPALCVACLTDTLNEDRLRASPSKPPPHAARQRRWKEEYLRVPQIWPSSSEDEAEDATAKGGKVPLSRQGHWEPRFWGKGYLRVPKKGCTGDFAPPPSPHKPGKSPRAADYLWGWPLDGAMKGPGDDGLRDGPAADPPSHGPAKRRWKEGYLRVPQVWPPSSDDEADEAPAKSAAPPSPGAGPRGKEGYVRVPQKWPSPDVWGPEGARDGGGGAKSREAFFRVPQKWPSPDARAPPDAARSPRARDGGGGAKSREAFLRVPQKWPSPDARGAEAPPPPPPRTPPPDQRRDREGFLRVPQKWPWADRSADPERQPLSPGDERPPRRRRPSSPGPERATPPPTWREVVLRVPQQWPAGDRAGPPAAPPEGDAFVRVPSGWVCPAAGAGAAAQRCGPSATRTAGAAPGACGAARGPHGPRRSAALGPAAPAAGPLHTCARGARAAVYLRPLTSPVRRARTPPSTPVPTGHTHFLDPLVTDRAPPPRSPRVEPLTGRGVPALLVPTERSLVYMGPGADTEAVPVYMASLAADDAPPVFDDLPPIAPGPALARAAPAPGRRAFQPHACAPAAPKAFRTMWF